MKSLTLMVALIALAGCQSRPVVNVPLREYISQGACNGDADLVRICPFGIRAPSQRVLVLDVLVEGPSRPASLAARALYYSFSHSTEWARVLTPIGQHLAIKRFRNPAPPAQFSPVPFIPDHHAVPTEIEGQVRILVSLDIGIPFGYVVPNGEYKVNLSADAIRAISPTMEVVPHVVNEEVLTFPLQRVVIARSQ